MQDAEANKEDKSFTSPFSIKHIQLWGFKTFPNKTILKFSKGVNAVVGPNGCGKSNIIDAVRWVLGEQSPTMLRAKAMDELIYIGEKLKTGWAEVQMSLECSANFLFPEPDGTARPNKTSITDIDISRRLYKSGESEYRINGRECRLKDIHYLFMDTGAGTKAYSIVDQGQIGRFIDMSAKERRSLIEEAAGVVKYKLRREETWKRMEETRINLETIEKVILEIASQKETLEKQVQKTREYLKLRKEEDELKRLLILKRWSDLTNLLETCVKKDSEYDQLLAGETGNKNLILNTVENLENKGLDLENQYESMDRAILKSEDIFKNFQQDSFNLEKLLIDEENKLKITQNTLNDFENRKFGLQKKETYLKNDLEALNKNISETNDKINEWEKGVLESEEYCKNLKNAINELKNELVDILSQSARLESENRSLENNINKLTAQQKRITTETEQLETDISDSESSIEEFEIKLSDSVSILDELKNTIDNFNANKTALDREIFDINQLRRQKESLFSDINARYNALKNLYDSMEGIDKSNRILMKSFSGHSGALFENIRVLDGYDTVSDLMLADTSQAVIVKELENLHRILAFIREKGIEGARIICPAVLSNATQDKGDDLKNNYNEILKNIFFDPDLATVMENLLAKWQIKNNLQEALDALGNGEINFFLTRDNIIVTPWGEIILRKKGSEQGLITRKKEMDRLFSEKELLKNEIITIKNNEDSLKKLLNEINLNLGGKKNKADLLAREIDSIRSKIEIISAKLESKKERLTHLEFDLDSVNEEIEKNQEELKEISEKLLGIKGKKISFEESIKGRDIALKTQEDVLKRRKNAQQTCKIELERYNTQLNTVSKELSETARRLERISADKDNSLKDMDKIKNIIETRKKELENARLKRDYQNRELENSKNNLREIKSELDKLRQEIAHNSANLKAVELKIKEFNDNKTQISVQKAKTEQEMLLIRENFIENFNSSPEDTLENTVFNDFNPKNAEKRLSEITKSINEIGPVNLAADEEFKRLDERYEFLSSQKNDLTNSLENLKQAISSIDSACSARFKETFLLLNEKLQETFSLLFEGGSASLILQDTSDEGVDFMVRFPGKKLHHLNMLSGGEKALCAISLIFSLFLIKPSPFCIMDEVDAPLDEVNTLRFCNLLKKISAETQALVVTHNQIVMDAADILHGVTMEEKGISKLVAVDLVRDLVNN